MILARKKIMEEVSSSPEETQDEVTEKGGIAGPVSMTFFIFTVIAGLIYLPFYAEKNPLKEILDSNAWWVPNIGEYHPLILHLPIGIVALTVFMEVCRWLSFGRYRPLTGVGLFLAFLTGVFACVTGLVDLKVEGMVHDDWDDDMYKHMWMGIAFVVVLGLAFLAKIWGGRSGKRGPLYGVLLFGSAGILGYGANFGGQQTHGVCPVTNTLEGLELIKTEGGGDAQKKKESGSLAESAGGLLAFDEVVLPIMDQKCLACHSVESGKDKGDLLMDTYASLLKGGESQDGEDYRTLVPGDAEKSYMIEVMTLPMDDDMHMPPSKKTQMEPHEIELLTWWVNNIPSNVVLEDRTLAEMGAPQSILDAAAKVISFEEKEEPAGEGKMREAAPANMAEEERASLPEEVDSLKEDDSLETPLMEDPVPDFSEDGDGEEGEGEDLVKLELPVAEAMPKPSLVETLMTEEAVVDQLSKVSLPRSLSLSEGGIVAEAKRKKLETLNLYGGQFVDSGVAINKPSMDFDDLYFAQSQGASEEGGLFDTESRQQAN